MLRGINQQQIFEDEEDNKKFLEILGICKEISGFELYGYCLMGNHLHLLLKTVNEDLDLIFKRIGARYVYWYNWKYMRSGHLFQDRFKSEPISDDKYFMAALRYIHRNPLQANLCKTPDEYKWSSYRDYTGVRGVYGITDTELALQIAGLDGLKKYTNMSNTDIILDNDVKRVRLTDTEAKTIMIQVCNCGTVESFQSLNTEKRNEYIKKLSCQGISIRQLNRLTGISKGIIEKIRDL